MITKSEVKSKSKNVLQYLCLACGLNLISSCQFIQTPESENVSVSKAQESFIPQVFSSLMKESSYDVSFNDISGWNHISFFPQEYKQLRLSSAAYHIDATELSLNEEKHLEVSTVLVRKLANWERQHSNGIKVDLASKGVTFGNFKTFDFELLINEKKSELPYVEEAVNHYLSEINATIIKEQWLEELLVEPAKITFTFVGENHNDPQHKTATASYSYLVSDIDEVVNLKISQEDLTFSWQQHYQEKAASLGDISSENITAMIVTLDTGNNKTLRHYINEAGQHEYPENIEEYFLELGMTLRDPKIIKTSRLL
ncbi:hypothetical protein GCM10011501_33650 [Thalassotalea profundi]|uniref:Lipoprotein n=2 Tax=Thalassotalea profundi TaxID=2036687 RepID=A0ABQ3J3M2_9GAMM|nr:hypothetical protein GCM10011501_33650 [Thalassotalea profundi]